MGVLLYMDEILEIKPLPLPYDLDEKIFYYTDDEGNKSDELYSYNDFVKQLTSIAGINQDLLGK